MKTGTCIQTDKRYKQHKRSHDLTPNLDTTNLSIKPEALYAAECLLTNRADLQEKL